MCLPFTSKVLVHSFQQILFMRLVLFDPYDWLYKTVSSGRLGLKFLKPGGDSRSHCCCCKAKKNAWCMRNAILTLLSQAREWWDIRKSVAEGSLLRTSLCCLISWCGSTFLLLEGGPTDRPAGWGALNLSWGFSGLSNASAHSHSESQLTLQTVRWFK